MGVFPVLKWFLPILLLTTTAASAQTVSITRGQVPPPTTMQSAATGNGVGTALVVSGYPAAILDVTCSVCTGGTTLNFEGTADNSTWTSIYVARLQSLGSIVTTSLVGGLFQVQTGGALRSVRVEITNYSAGTITVKGYPSVSVASPISMAISSINSTVTVDGSGGTFPITAASLPLPTGAATSANQTNASQKTQIVDGSGNVIASTSNNLNVQCANCSGSGASAVDEATFTAGSSVFAPSGGFYQTTATSNALTNGQQGFVQMTAQRALFANLRNASGTEIGTASTPVQVSLANTAANSTAVKVDNSGVTQPVSVADGSDVTLGAKADAKSTATDTTAITIMQVLKEISFMEQTPASRAVTNAGTFATQSAITAASGSIASGAIASGAVASGAIASGAVASGAYASGSISDGAQVTLGAKADAKSTATDTTAITAMQVLKEISFMAQNPAALPANQSVNEAQINGVAPLMGNGPTGTGSARVTVSSDNSAVAGFGVAATAGAVPANAVYPGAEDASGNLIGDINCTSSKIYDASTSGNTELVAISGSKHVYICGYEMFSGGTVNVSLVAGTGTACASAASGATSTGTSGSSAALTPAWQFTAQTGKISAYPTHGYLIDAGSANALCLKTSAGVAVQAQVFYQQR